MARTTPAHRHNKSKHFKRAHDLKRRMKDEDQIYDEYLAPKDQSVDVDLPGLGQFYCQVCAKHFKDTEARDAHYVTPLHKRLLKRLKNNKPYSIEESLAASGQGSYQYSKQGFKPGEKSIAQKLAEIAAAKRQEADLEGPVEPEQQQSEQQQQQQQQDPSMQ